MQPLADKVKFAESSVLADCALGEGGGGCIGVALDHLEGSGEGFGRVVGEGSLTVNKW